jgi:single-strand DNA-binding protein
MAGDTQITLVGNLVDDPELKFTPSGAAVAKFRIASTPRTLNKQTNTWEDGEALFLTCNVWRQPAEHCAESLQKGMRVIVQGRLRQRSYDTKEGEKRTVFEVEVDEVGPSLQFATAKVTRASSQGGGQQQRPQGQSQGSGWGGGQNQQQGQGGRGQQAPAQGQPNGWGQQQPAGAQPGYSDEPPF